MTRKIGLDIVRATAISLVLASHFFKDLDFIGMYGVELFFALSGYLIGGILYRRLTTCNRWSFAEVKVFWLRRWWRTLPNYYLFLAISVPFYGHFGGLPKTFAAFLPFLIFCQDLTSRKPEFYGVSWSLCVEEWFYFLFPLCILLFTSLRCSKRAAFLGATFLFLLFPPILRELMFARVDPAAVRMVTIPRLDALFYGVATAFICARHQLSGLVKIALAALAVVGLVALLAFQHRSFQTKDLVPFYRTAFQLLPICFSLILPLFASLDHLPSRCGILTRPITNLSLWSYSIYLSHIPVLYTVYALFGHEREHPFVNLLSKIVGLALCLYISSLIYKYFENKLMSLRPVDPAKQVRRSPESKKPIITPVSN